MNDTTYARSGNPTFDDVRTAARGRWPWILTQLGIDADHLNKPHVPCPGCGGKDRFRFDDMEGRGTWVCGGGGDEKAGDGFQLLEHVHGWSRAESLKAVAEVLGMVDCAEPPPPRKAAPKSAMDNRQAKQARAAELARMVIEAAPKARTDHPYLLRKRLPYQADEHTQLHPFPKLHQMPVEKLRARIDYHPKASGTPIEGDILIVPVGNWDEIRSLEFIDKDGRKTALARGRKAGCWWAAQAMPETTEHLLIGEGVATVLSAIETTGWPGVAALSCGNLPKVAQAMRQRYPAATITILADIGNGQAKAEEAAKAIDGVLAVPDFGPERHPDQTDFNDLALCRGLETVREQIMDGHVTRDQAVGKPDTPRQIHPLDGAMIGAYRVIKGRLYREVEKGDEVHTIAVANFAARIVREIQRTDGLETRFLFEIEGWLGNGRPLPKAMVTAKEFAGLNWICEYWGSAALVYPGMAAKDHCRAAIQMMSEPERATIYAHLGWTEIDGKPVFIHAGGGIGADGTVAGIEVDPGESLTGFQLPEARQPGAVANTLRDLLAMPGTVAPEAIVWPLLLYALGAVLGHSPFSMYLAGGSGARKTSLALAIQSLFGHRGAEPPASWEATANALEGIAFQGKDVAILVDDFAPTGDARSQDEMRRKAARVLRSQGNKTGRLRMKPDGTLAGDKPPRGSIIVTGEDLPPGHSVRARCLFIEIKPEDRNRGIPGDVDLAALSEAQEQARNGRYAEIMAAWIRWLAPRVTDMGNRLRERIETLRPEWASPHGRTTDAVARLQATWEMFSEFAIESGAITQEEAAEFHHGVTTALLTVADSQGNIQKSADPAERFIDLLQSLMNSGRAHLKSKEDESRPPDDPARWGWQTLDHLSTTEPTWQPQGTAIGWVDETNVYLDPQIAYAELDRLARDTGEPLLSPRTFWKRLAERGVIRAEQAKDGIRSSVRRRFGQKLRRVIEIPTATLYVENSGHNGNMACSPHGSRAEAVTGNSGVTGSSGHSIPALYDAWPGVEGCDRNGPVTETEPVTGKPKKPCGPNPPVPAVTGFPDIKPTCENSEKNHPDFTRSVEDEADRLAGKKPDRGVI